MTAVDDILARVPIADVARELGVSQAQAELLARQSIPTLLGGMRANASDPGGASSLENALVDHAASDTTNPSLDQIDVADGSKIVGNIFGANSDSVIQSLGARSDGGSSLVGKLLPILAPIVLKYLAGKVLGGSGGSGGGAANGGGGVLGQILGEMLGGRESAPAAPSRERRQAPASADGPTFDGPNTGGSANSELRVPGYQDGSDPDSAGNESRDSDAKGEGSLMDSLKDLFGMGRRG